MKKGERHVKCTGHRSRSRRFTIRDSSPSKQCKRRTRLDLLDQQIKPPVGGGVGVRFHKEHRIVFIHGLHVSKGLFKLPAPCKDRIIRKCEYCKWARSVDLGMVRALCHLIMHTSTHTRLQTYLLGPFAHIRFPCSARRGSYRSSSGRMLVSNILMDWIQPPQPLVFSNSERTASMASAISGYFFSSNSRLKDMMMSIFALLSSPLEWQPLSMLGGNSSQ